MQVVRLLGSALVLMLAANASIATAPVLASTGLCSAEVEECFGEEIYPATTAIEAEGVGETQAEFETSLGTLICKKAALSGSTSEMAGEPLEGEVAALTFGECKIGVVNCTLESKNLPYDASIEDTGSGDGTVNVSSGGSGAPSVAVVCGLSINCTFSASEPSLQFTGGDPATLEAEVVGLETSGGTCPKEVFWSSEYQVKQPKPAFVENIVYTVLCKSKEATCKAGNTHKASVLQAAQTTKPSFKYWYKGAENTFTCDNSSLKLETTAEKGSPLPGKLTELTFANCSNSCAVKAHNLSYLAEITATKLEGYGVLYFRNAGAPGPPVFEVKCATKTCFYTTQIMPLNAIDGANEAKIEMEEWFNLLKEFGASKSDADCDGATEKEPYPMKWASTNYKVSTPTDVWVTKG